MIEHDLCAAPHVLVFASFRFQLCCANALDSSLELVSSCSAYTKDELKEMYEKACVVAADGHAPEVFADLDAEQENDDEGDILFGIAPDQKDLATECEQFLKDLTTCNEAELLMDEPPPPREEERDDLLEVPDSEVLRKLLEKPNSQDNELNLCISVDILFHVHSCSLIFFLLKLFNQFNPSYPLFYIIYHFLCLFIITIHYYYTIYCRSLSAMKRAKVQGNQNRATGYQARCTRVSEWAGAFSIVSSDSPCALEAHVGAATRAS